MQNTNYQIFTIGHGNRKIECFIELLVKNNIEFVIDVRSIPYSRYHPQFRQLNLKASLESVGINYLWLGKELGGRPTDPNLYINGKVDYNSIKKTTAFKTGIEQVIQLIAQQVKVTLMCSEGDYNQCHRKQLISDELIRAGISVFHISKYGNLEHHIISSNPDLFF
jgi:uncharacterized protein (DUF488 family)